MVVRNTRSIMLIVAACLLPGLLLSAWLISPMLLANAAVAVLIAGCTEAICLKLKGRFDPVRLVDGSSLVTALIIAVAMPPSVPLAVLAFATITAIALAKYAYGGLGNNVFNPAMVGYAAALLSFPLALSSWPDLIDGLSGATALTAFKFRGGATVADIWSPDNGFGSLGAADTEWINAAFLGGGIILLLLRLAAWRTSAGMLLGITLIAAAGYDSGSSASFGSPTYHLFTGGTMLAAFFVVTDPVTHPASTRGQWLFGLLVGALTVLIRVFGSHPDGIAFAVLLANAVTPYLDRRLAQTETANG
jgi:electron transport complex protein RnfD